jgi:type IX secretion system PorP/SprF family membrane protein
MTILNKLATFRHLLILLICSISIVKISAQDIHFSQSGNSPLNLSPAQAGVFGGDMRFVGNYRNQWRSVPVPYLTFSGSVENKFYHKKGKYDRYFTGSLMLDYDRQGFVKLTSLQVGIPISYTAPIINKNNFLTIGVTPMFGQRSFNTSKWTTDKQWDGCFYNSGLDPQEDQLLGNTNLKYFDISGGVNYRTQSSVKRHKMDVGVAMHHINRPDHNFFTTTTDYKLASKFTVYALGVLQVANNIDLVGHGLFQKQGTYKEIVSGIGGRFHLNKKEYQELALQVGMDFRHRYTDALIPHVEVHYRTWQMGLSYDINTSDFKAATNNRGGPELSLIYRLYRVKPLPFFKTCPII